MGGLRRPGGQRVLSARRDRVAGLKGRIVAAPCEAGPERYTAWGEVSPAIIPGRTTGCRRRQTASAQALERCRQMGTPVIIATSRSPRSVRQLLGAAFLHQYSHVVLNGALAWAAAPFQGRYQWPLDTPVALQIVEAVLRRHASVLITVEVDGERLVTNVPRHAPTLWQHFLATLDLVLPFEALCEGHVLKIMVDGQHRDLMATGRWLQTAFRDTILVVPAHQGTILNIMTADTTKERGVEAVLTSMGRTLSRAWVFGDDVPDLSLLQAAGVAVAMANACQEVKTVARYRTAHHEADGVAQFLEPWLDGWSRAQVPS